MYTFIQDLRYGVRMLIKNPGVTVVAIVALTLGIGACTAIFSVVNAVLRRPLPFDEPDKLMFLSERSPQLDGMSISYPNFLDWKAQNQVFENIAVFRTNSYNLTEGGEPERVVGGMVSADTFAALRVQPKMGRTFTGEEDQPGGNPVALLSEGLWKRRFGEDKNIINQTVLLNGKSYTIIGVMVADFQFPGPIDLWVPVGQESNNPGWQNRGNHPGLYGVARLKPGVTFEQARDDMDRVAVGLEEQYPNSNTGNRVGITPMHERVVRNIKPALIVLFGAVAFVLLIACANVANLLLARATARQKEIAIRTALGASRLRLVRQLLTESLLLSIVGGGLGLLVAMWGVEAIIAINPNGIPRAQEINLDKWVLGFTFTVSVVTGIVFGLMPALQASKVDLNETLKDAGRGSTGGLRQRLRRALVVAEVALSLVLLIGAGLMIQSFYRLQQVDPGFNPDNLLTLQMSLPAAKYPESKERRGFYEQLLQRVNTLPGVSVAAVASGLPLGNNGNQTSFMIEGQPEPERGQTPLMEVVYASPEYFRAMGITLLQGELFTGREDENTRVFVIDEAFAKKHWPDENPVGKQIRFGGTGANNPRVTVAGVVARVKMEGLNTDSNRVQGYFPYHNNVFSTMRLVARTTGDPTALANVIRQEVLAIDKDQPIFNIRTMEEIRMTSVAPQRLYMVLLGIFAAVALVLAAVGIYGVMSYSVTQRTHEIGIRMALGARPASIMKMVVGQGLMLTLLGVGIGVIGAFILVKVIASLLSSMLFGVSATDPLTFISISVILTAVALGACAVPARRATKVDPITALRYE